MVTKDWLVVQVVSRYPEVSNILRQYQITVGG